MTTFSEHADAELVAWKLRSAALDGLSRDAAPYGRRPRGPLYDVCLPADQAQHNLLPEAREKALERFASLGIRWHDGTAAGPSNHLRSSQVQCVNALMPFVDRPDAIRALFGTVLPIGEVIPFGDPAAPGDHVVFEWIGLADYLHEGNGKPRTRGANTTSTDAAIRYRTPDGSIEIALIEWKYSESYSKPIDPDDTRHVTRRARYESLWRSVVRDDLVDLDDLFVEPVYQLLRQQMLAHEMERAGELGATKVRVVYTAPSANDALWASILSEKLRTLSLPVLGRPARDLRELWDALRHQHDRFVWFDTAAFVAPDAPTSEEFKDRYGHLALAKAVA